MPIVTYRPILGKAFVNRNKKRNSLLKGNLNLANEYAAGTHIIIDNNVVVIATTNDRIIELTRLSCDKTNCHHFNDNADGNRCGYWYSSEKANTIIFINGPKKNKRKIVNAINSINLFFPSA
jgi:hypothetical protein